MTYGALADGTGDTVATWLTGGSHDLGLGWTTLANIKTLYPEVTALTNTIDEAAFRRAFTAAAALITASVYFPAGRYVFTSDAGRPVPASAALEVYGDGISTVLLRKSSYISADHQYMLAFLIAAVSTSLTFRDLALDGGFSRQSAPPTPYAWEHCTTLRVVQSGSGSLARVEYANLTMSDPVADQIATVFNTVAVTNQLAIYRDIVSVSRSATRSDIQMYPGTLRSIVRDTIATSVECEYATVIPTSRRYIALKNLQCDLLDIGGSYGGVCYITADNITTGRTLLWKMSGIFSDCDLTFDTEARFNYVDPTRFVRCTLRLDTNEGTEVCGISVYRNDTSTSYIRFDSCLFTLNTSNDALVADGACIREGTAVPAAEFNLDSLGDMTELRDCRFDHRAPSALIAGRCGRLVTRDCRIAGHVAGVAVQHGSGAFYGRWESYDDDFAACSAASIGLRYGYLQRTTIRVSHVRWDERWRAVSLLEGTEGRFPEVTWQSTRTLPVSAAPVAGIAGDRAALIRRVSGQACEWLCTKTGATAATWIVTKVAP